MSTLKIGGTQKGEVTSTKKLKNPNLRSFLVALILGSYSTVNEKFDLLYDLFDWADGSSDNIKPEVVFDLISCVLQRCLYPMT